MTKKADLEYRGEPLRPCIRYAGGKTWLADTMIAFSKENPTNRFVEPFAGGMAISLAVRHPVTIINDINPHVINLYRQIKNGLDLKIRMENSASCYKQNRERFNELIKEGDIRSAEAAQLFFYLNKTGFNGLSRFNKRGLFNVPFGKYESINYGKGFESYRNQFSSWEFSDNDFEKIVIGDNDFTFIDCPYDDSFVSYSSEGFTWEDQQRTALWASKLSGPVVSTNLSTDRVVEMYRDLGFLVRFMKARRSISCKGDNRKPVLEMIAVKNANIPPIFLEKSIDA